MKLIAGAGATIFTSAIIARTLGPDKMGVYGYAMWIVGAVGTLANLGVPTTLTKYIAEYVGRGDAAQAAHVAKKLLLVQLAIAAAAAGLTASVMFFVTSDRGIIGIAALILFMQAMLQSLTGTLAGIQRFDRIAVISIYVSMAQIASVGTVAILRGGVVGMLWATFVGSAVATWLFYRNVADLVLTADGVALAKPLQTPNLYSRIGRFSLTLSYILLVDQVVWQRSEVLFLKWYSSLAQLAFYSIAYSVAAKLNDVSSVLSSTLLPLYSGSYGRSGLDDIGRVFSDALKYVQMIMVFPCFLAATIARPLVHMLYGSRYDEMVPTLQVLLVGLALSSIGAVGSPLLVGTEKHSFIAKYGTVVALVNVVLDFGMIPRYGALGAALANCSAQVLGALGGTIYTVRYSRAPFPWRSMATIYASAIVAVIPAVYCSESGTTRLAVSVLAGALLYLVFLRLSGEVGKREFGILKAVLFAKTHGTKPLHSRGVS